MTSDCSRQSCAFPMLISKADWRGRGERSPLQVNVPDGSTCKLQGRILKLIQWHFHTPSEHSFAGRRQVMEAHFVHKDVQSGAG